MFEEEYCLVICSAFKTLTKRRKLLKFKIFKFPESRSIKQPKMNDWKNVRPPLSHCTVGDDVQ